MKQVTIIGAGLAGLSAVCVLAGRGISCNLVSLQTSERAQSVMAEGGINAALNVMGEDDRPAYHYDDTIRGGVWLGDPNAVAGMTAAAPELVRWLSGIGVPFSMSGDALIQRNFGGQKKKRTAFCKSSTGKALMTAMIDEVRKYEGTCVRRYPHHRLRELLIRDGVCTGVRITDEYTQEQTVLPGSVILAFGGPCGLFPGRTTGTTANDGNALATVFTQGVELANLEFIQYHPTTVEIVGKRLLISEAARGEGGRLFIMRDGRPWYFMEELYPELGNLMPRDVISREMEKVVKRPDCLNQVCLDLTVLPREVWKKKLPDLRSQVKHYTGIDPAKEPVPVSPGIHFFMGGISVSERHETSLPGLYAAGECACQYHGANRLGGNSLLGALYGGRIAAISAAEAATGYDAAGDETTEEHDAAGYESAEEHDAAGYESSERHSAIDGKRDPAYAAAANRRDTPKATATPDVTRRLGAILAGALGITRCADELHQALADLERLRGCPCTETDLARIALGDGMLRSALAREESRGSHQRSDFPSRDDSHFQKTTIASWNGGAVDITFREIPEKRNSA